jgi:hypothetical protein
VLLVPARITEIGATENWATISPTDYQDGLNSYVVTRRPEMSDDITLEDIIDLCDCGVSIEVNSHTCNYRTLEEGLADCMSEYNVPDDIIAEMRDRRRIVRVQAYPRNAVSFEFTYGGSVQEAIDRMYDLLRYGDSDD